MRRTASEVLRSLEMRVARLEGRTAAGGDIGIKIDIKSDASEYLEKFKNSDFSFLERLSIADFNNRDFKLNSIQKDKFGLNVIVSLHPTNTIYYFVAAYSFNGTLMSIEGVFDDLRLAKQAVRSLTIQ
jgi:hypothetical protein